MKGGNKHRGYNTMASKAEVRQVEIPPAPPIEVEEE
jgi:hypothetical protein